MDPTIVSLVAIVSPMIAALFGAYTLAMRQSRQDWKGLYEQERSDHKETRKAASDDSLKNSESIRELADFLHELPRRTDDWANRSPGRGRQ